MELEDTRYILIRSFVFLMLFMLLHYLYDWFPNIIIGLFSGINEAVWQHMKIGFYSYLILMTLELIFFRSKINDLVSFYFSRVFSAVLYPWIMFILFFMTRVFYPLEFPLIIEVITAIIITYFSGAFSGFLEIEIIKLEYNKRLKFLILILLVILIAEFTAFTFYLPWHDVLADPYL